MLLAVALLAVLNRKGDQTKTKEPVKDEPQNNATVSFSLIKKNDKPKETSLKPANEQQSIRVKIFYLVYNDATGKIMPGPVFRDVKGTDPIPLAFKELSHSPKSDEGKRGLISSIPEGMKMKVVSMKDGIVTIDCDNSFSENAHGDILTGRLNQIFYTATQFPRVRGIIITVNGKVLRSLGGEGLVVSWPMKKSSPAMKEIEVKAKVSDLSDLRSRVLALGGIYEGEVSEKDLYYNHPSRDFSLTGEAFRIRISDTGSCITYKGPREQGIAKIRYEGETGIDEPEIFIEMIEKLSFRFAGTVEKKREKFILNECTIVLDTVAKLGYFIEIEMVGEDEKLCQEKVMRTADLLGITLFEQKSYLTMILELNAV